MDIAAEMNTRLFEWLEEVDAAYPIQDPEYDAERYKLWHQGIIERKLPQLEKQRLNFLTDGWEPNEDWWGSKVDD